MERSDQRCKQLQIITQKCAFMGPLSLAVLGILSMMYSVWSVGFIDPAILYHSHFSSYVFSILCFENFSAQNLKSIPIIRLPWDQNTITGWMLEMAYHMDVFLFYFFVSFSVLTLFISICEFHRSLYELFDHLIAEFDMNETNKSDEIYQLKVCLRDTIVLHTSAKRRVQASIISLKMV